MTLEKLSVESLGFAGKRNMTDVCVEKKGSSLGWDDYQGSSRSAALCKESTESTTLVSAITFGIYYSWIVKIVGLAISLSDIV